MKGIILAGGKGTRLHPVTLTISKQMLPIYDKPMIYYPLSTLMLAGITEILIISTPEHLPFYQTMFNDGSSLGLKIEYEVQEEARGLADAFIIGQDFIGNDSVCIILGDNIFYGSNFSEKLRSATQLKKGGIVFGYYIEDPSSYGVLEIENDNVIGVEEKPKIPKSNYAMPGIYFFDNSCIEYAKNVIPSARGEVEITDVVQQYINSNSLQVELLKQGVAWLDTGTHENLIEASSFVRTIEKRQGLKIACIEEISYNLNLISREQFINLAKKFGKSEYGCYLQKIIQL